MEVNARNRMKVKMELVIYAVIMTIIAGVFTNIGLALMVHYTESSQSYISALFFIICMIFGFIIIPQFVTSKIFNCNFLQFSSKQINKRRSLILFTLVLASGLYIGGVEKTLFFFLIAVCEEYLFRHTIFKILLREYSVFWSAIIGSLIFAVILHSNHEVINNLVVRMPFSLIFYYISIKYKLQDAIALHWIYNILITTL